MEGYKIILWLLLGVAALVATYLYVRHLGNSGYEDRDIYLHIFHDVPLWVLRKKGSEDVYSGSPYSGHVPEYRKAEQDISESYPSYYGAGYGSNSAARRNGPPVDFAHNQQLLAVRLRQGQCVLCLLLRLRQKQERRPSCGACPRGPRGTDRGHRGPQRPGHPGI